VAIRDEVQRILDALSEHAPPASESIDGAPDGAPLAALAVALREALDALSQRVHGPPPIRDPAPSLDRLGDHAIDLLARLAAAAQHDGARHEARDLRSLVVALACCVVRSGGELTYLQPVADAAAELADRERAPEQNRLLYPMVDDIIRGLSPRFCGTPSGNPRFQPWRALLINRAVMATRALEPEWMVPAFDALVDELPAEAPAFFREGMRQMTFQVCPEAVREVMRRYHDRRADGERLH
jgi:hypothetical protein